MKPKILAVIPARGGSKGVPRKNIKMLAGKPLIAWTIEEAKKSKYITSVILSSEDDEIIEVAEKYGCDVPFKRPMEIAQDDTAGIMPVLHAIEQCPGYDYVVLLQPTSPLRTVEDIDGCIEYAIENNAEFCVSVKETEKSPFWMYTVNDGKMGQFIKQNQLITNRQELPKIYILNGAVYFSRIKSIVQKKSFLTEETTAYIMPFENSYDIDTELDFKVCQTIMLERKICHE
ncbi:MULTISPECIES: cytidylyltransferase domain-containing protein [Lysinibacillus]|uniref:acylneuraminate cytidylyltransferase family protein n=1 Tax=Lysinibacillus TaxID=400634 RepID=UPI001CBE39A7|nr:acylneuraminate cytidylyltransferase family protein [Lysinibacillus sphaericus]